MTSVPEWPGRPQKSETWRLRNTGTRRYPIHLDRSVGIILTLVDTSSFCKRASPTTSG